MGSIYHRVCGWMWAGIKRMDAGHHLRSIWRLLLYVCVCVFVEPMRVTLGSDLKLFLICIRLQVSIQLLTQRCYLQASFNNDVVLFVKALMSLYFACCVCFRICVGG